MLFDIEDNLPAITFRAHRKMHPYRRISYLVDKLIKVFLSFVSDIEQDNCIA